jgi:LysM repeat protein
MIESEHCSCLSSFVQTRKRLPAGAVLLAFSLYGYAAGGCSREQGASLPETPRPAHAAVKEPAAESREMFRYSTSETNGPNTIIDSAQQPSDAPPDMMYVVQKGDSVRGIAARFSCDYREVVNRNSIRYDRKRDWFVLHPGQKLLLPGIRAAAAPSDRARKSGFYLRGMFEEPEPFRYHLIKKGESLWTISRVYCISMHKIISLNGITDPDRIVCGNLLKLPPKPGAVNTGKKFSAMTRQEKVHFLKERTVPEGHPYLDTLVDVAEQFNVDPRLYASLIWEESWFNQEARSRDNCRRLAQLDPRFHRISDNARDNFEKSLRYLSHEFSYYRRKGFDSRAAIICAIAAYNGGNTRIRRFIRNGLWDGQSIDTIPLSETREHIRKVFTRCRNNYHAVL